MEEERKKRREMQIIEEAMNEEAKKLREEQRKKEEKEEKRKYLEQKKKRLLEQKKEEEKMREQMEEQKRILEEEEKINNLYNLKIKEINNYFANLKFHEIIISKGFYNLKLDIITDQIFLKNSYENDLMEHYDKKISEKKKEWQDQITRAKWKVSVQAYGDLRCENGCELIDIVVCYKPCNGNLFWVDSDEKYAICNKCPENQNVQKISEDLFCQRCNAKSLAKVKWIKGYKP